MGMHIFFLKDLKFFYPHQQNNTRDLLYLEISWDTSEFRANYINIKTHLYPNFKDSLAKLQF